MLGAHSYAKEALNMVSGNSSTHGDFLKVVNEEDLRKEVMFRDVRVHLANLVEQPDFVVRTVVVPPNSSVPPKPHAHEMRQINYVIDGKLAVTNGKETVDLKKGDFIILESFEEHYFATTNDYAHVFEVQFVTPLRVEK
jgi:quercetin dioxygenase-like cupin family protein